jgi:hypothetical protein
MRSLASGLISMDASQGRRMHFRAELPAHIVAYAFAMHLLFGSVVVLDSFGLTFFFYFPRTIQITMIGPSMDLLAWVATVAFLSALMIHSSLNHQRWDIVGVAMAGFSLVVSVVLLLAPSASLFQQIVICALFAVATTQFAVRALAHGTILNQSVRAVLVRSFIYLLTFFAALEISSAVHYVLQSFNPSTQIGRANAGLELQFSYVSYSLLPWLYVAFLFSWAWVPLGQRLIRSKFSKETQKGAGTVVEFGSSQTSHWSSKLLDPRFVLALAVAAFIGYYPYFQNPPWVVGTDARLYYLGPLMRMNAQGPSGGFLQALSEWHPAVVALMYSVQLAVHSTAFDVVRLTPLFLVITLGLASWWFLGRNKSTGFGLLIFVLSVLSMTTTIGFYSSILANWMALVVWVLFFAYVSFRADRGFRIIDAVVLLALSTLILFLHPWTWGVFAASILIVAILTLIEEKRKGLRGAMTLVSVIVIDLVVTGLSLVLLGEMEGRGVADALFYYTFVILNPASVLVFWDTLTRLTQVWAPFFSPLSLAVSIIGVFYLAQSTGWRRRLIFAWLFVSCVGSILIAPVGFDPANSAGSESQLWRLLFLTPFQLAAPFGVAWLTQLPSRLRVEATDSRPVNVTVSPHGLWLLALFAIGVLMAWAPSPLSPILMLLLLPALTCLALIKQGSGEEKFLKDLIIVVFLLVAFNNVSRALSQLLLASHNCTKC